MTTCKTAALTQEQRQFAADNHNLIYRFLHERGWAVGEYYDIAALGYLSAVARYLTKPELLQYAFSTVAWRAMDRGIAAFHRAERRHQDAERRYMAVASNVATDPLTELEARLIFHDLVSNSSRTQHEIASLRMQGYSVEETARSLGLEPWRVRKLLKELFRVYLQLYMK